MKSNDSRNKRVVFMIGNLQRHGAEKVISLVADHFSKKGWSVDIITLLGDKCEFTLNPAIRHIPLCRTGRPYAANALFWLRGIRRYLRKEKPQAVVSFVARINILTIIAGLGLKKRIIVSERNDPAADGRGFATRFATHVLYGMADSVVFQTRRAQSCFPRGIAAKSAIIPNPVKVTACAAETKRRKIVAVGRLEPQKNHSLLLKAFSVVRNCHRDYELYIYGDGSLKSELERQAEALSITGSVILPGSVENVHEKIADAEMFVLSSDYEGLSNALLEAMMMGLPCISTQCAGSDEAIQDGVNGLLVPVGSGERLAEAMERLINERELAGKLGMEAARMSEPYRCGRVLRQWEAVITGQSAEGSAV